MDIEEGGYKGWAVDVEPGDANSFPAEDAIEHVYVVVTDKDSGEIYEGKLFLKSAPGPGEPGERDFPRGETLTKGRSFRDDAIEDAKQQEYWDSKREERSRELIRHIQQEMRDREFRR
jgi:hypothetical protein